MIYGYARVSTDGQSLAAQLDQLSAEACRVFAEKISGAATNRPQLKKLLGVVKEGDIVVVTRLDRLARSTRDLLNILARLTEKKALSFVERCMGGYNDAARETDGDGHGRHGRIRARADQDQDV